MQSSSIGLSIAIAKTKRPPCIHEGSLYFDLNDSIQ